MKNSKTKIGIITFDKYPDLHPSDQDFTRFLPTDLVEIYPIVWTNPIGLAQMEALIFRSCWDYHTQLADFQEFIEKIAVLKIPIWNPLADIRRNLHKFYLQDLAQAGIPILPTLFLKNGESIAIQLLMKNQNWQKAVVKPAVSASSTHTYLIDQNTPEIVFEQIANLLITNDLLVQKFIPEIATLGEVSIIFFANGFQYNILKKPKMGDFRVQQEYGGSAVLSHLPSPIIKQARQVLDHFTQNFLFARVDGIILADVFHLMELELIEPYLFTDLHPQASQNLAQSVVLKLNHFLNANE
jgi:glutathione synthase/RimK-type ligase-like ATP-grasp enzyme